MPTISGPNDELLEDISKRFEAYRHAWDARSKIVLSEKPDVIINEFLLARKLDPAGNWTLHKFLRSFYPWVPERVDPFYRAMNEIALSKMEGGESADSEILLNEAIILLPAQANAYKNLGTYYQKNGKPAQARSVLEKAAFLDPSDPDIERYLGLVQE
jgi:tetratricopeptide (TPR) repeat protein